MPSLSLNVDSSTHGQTARSTGLFIFAFMGGALVACSFLAEYLFQDSRIRDASDALVPQAQVLALLGAVALGIPLIYQALRHLAAGEMHMDELVALAIVAGIALGRYQ